MTAHPNPFSTDTAKLAIEKIIDRADELEKLLDTIIVQKGNILVVGESGIGKTCLLRKVRAQIAAQRGSTILMAEIGAEALAQGAAKFLPNVVLRIFDAAAVQVFNLPQSALLSGLMSDMNLGKLVKRKLSHFLRLFTLVRPGAMKFTTSRSNDAGVSFGATVKMGESLTTSRDVDLSASDFMGLTAELLKILSKHGITQVVVFGDEANHIKPEVEVDIMRENLEAFSEKNVQFVLTTRPELREPALRIGAFNGVCSVDAFASYADAAQLFREYVACAECSVTHVTFEEPVIREIWHIARGRPRQIQALAHRMWASAYADSRPSAGMADLVHALSEVYALTPRY